MKLIALILTVLLYNLSFGQFACNNWLSTPSNPAFVNINQLSVQGDQVTVEALINRTQPYLPGGGDNTEGDIVSKHNDFSDVNYLLRPNHGYITTTNGFFGTPDICDIKLNKTYHVALVYDGAALKFYRDGQLMSQVAASGNLIQNNWRTRIGWYDPSGFTTQFIGYINEVRIWNVARSQAQIKTYMNSSLPNPTTQVGLLGYYTFDNLNNKQGNSTYNGTLGGSASINAINPDCTLILDSCSLATQPQTCNGSLGSPVVNINFGSGVNNPGPPLSTTIPGASTNYNYASYATGTPPNVIFDGDYSLVNQVPVNSAWFTGATDHTGNPNGYMAFFNSAPSPGEFYKQTVTDLCPGTTYEFAAWVANAINPSVLPSAILPNITFKILDANSQALLASYNTGDIPNTNSFTWKQYSFLFTLPAGNNSVTLVLANNNIGGNAQPGNDLAIDDITFKPCGPLTTASLSNSTLLDSTGVSNCSSANLYGIITGSFNNPTYQWQVSRDGGNTYSNIIGATALNANYSGFTNGSYLFRLLSAEAGNINSPNCRFISNVLKLTVTGCTTQKSVVINDYTPVIAFNICNNSITVEDATKYNTGDTVLIIQMKGALIDTSNTAAFGGVINYNNAGNYELNYVKNKSGNVVELKNLLTKQYEVPNGKVQLIRVPYFQNYTAQDTLTCLPWDGKKGGVLVLNAANNILLNADINVSGKGFRGGSSKNSMATVLNCFYDDYSYPASSIAAADKGESIYDIGYNNRYGKGANANGGGGGSGHNSGGGGGGNGGNGGLGGYQLEACGSSPYDNRGLGGNSLFFNNAANKIFLGGGGGSGHTDNAGGIDMNGAAGGGIAIVMANTLTNNGHKIVSNGGDVVNCDNTLNNCHDGSGGGGSGGSVLLKINSFVNNIQIEANGGKGGDLVIFDPIAGAGRIGPGGGGGGGVVWFSQNTTPALAATANIGGNSGVIIGDANNPWGATNGTDGQLLHNLQIPLAVTPFKPNIDSVRIKQTLTACNTFDLKGFGYTNTSAITQWQWVFDDGTTASTQNTTHTYTIQGNHNVKLIVSDLNGCKDSVSITLNAVTSPAAPNATTILPTCIVTTGSINIASPLGINYQYSIDGLNFQTAPSFNNLLPASYNLNVKDISTGCISAASTFVITAAALPAVPGKTITQPTCTATTGAINVTAPLGTNLQYSIDGLNYQTSTTFSNVVSGTYNITVKNINSGCISAPVLATIDPPLQVPTTPSSIPTQPVCNNQTGSITILSPIGANIQYSINNSTYQSSVAYNNVVPGTYSITAKNINSGCVSSSSAVTINAGTGTPAAPLATVTSQPDCLNTTGFITVTQPLGAGFQYSADGINFQNSSSFAAVASGNYNIIVKNMGNNCISSATPVVVNAIPSPPSIPDFNVTQPTCAVVTGTVNITNSQGTNLQYNLNNGTFQSVSSFAGLSPGSYTLIALNPITKCKSSAAVATVAAVPLPPSAPIVGNIIQPTCTVTQGAVSVSAPTGFDFEYSINGGSYQASNQFINLASGSYNLTVKNTKTVCVSSSTLVTINPTPPLPPSPVTRVTVQPSCIISSGTVAVSSPLGSNYQYSINGGAYQFATTFTDLQPGQYEITVKDESISCVSLPTKIVVSANTSSPGTYRIPNAFTPNGDGFNECFGIKYWGIISDFKLIIYNRWGAAVFTTSNPNDCWNGKYKGIPASQGNYVYYIKAMTLCGPVEKRGNVLLIR